MRITDQFVFFWGDNDVFSNFHPAPFTFSVGSNIIQVPTSEHGFMYIKARFFEDNAVANQILLTKKPFDAKKLGRTIKNFDAELWDSISYTVMYDINKSKYEQNPQLMISLLQTYNRELVEASPMDKVWGIGLGENDLDAEDKTMWRGQNKLGLVLTNLRNDFFKFLDNQ